MTSTSKSPPARSCASTVAIASRSMGARFQVGMMTLTSGASGRSPLPGSASAVIAEVEGDQIVPQGEAVFVRVGVVVATGGKVDELRLTLANVLHPVPDTARNADDGALVIAQHEDVEQTARRRSLAIVIDPKAETAATDENAIVLAQVHLPGARFAGTGDDFVGVDDRIIEPRPVEIP